MILAFSTSSPWSSVAAFDSKGIVLWHGKLHSPQSASAACLKLLEQMEADTSIRVGDAEMFLADFGPGSFTGVRVGVTLAKSFGFLFDKPVAGASSFDLISPTQTVVLPSKKGEYFVREPGCAPLRTTSLPAESFVGYGGAIEQGGASDAANFSKLISSLSGQSAMSFTPIYLIEPSISTPKKPFAGLEPPHA